MDPSLRVALRAGNNWYSALGWPRLPNATWLPRRAEFSEEGDALPSVDELLAWAVAPCVPRELPQQAQQQQQHQQPGARPLQQGQQQLHQQGEQQQQQGAAAFVPSVPSRRRRPPQKPASWDALKPCMTPFEAKPGAGFNISRSDGLIRGLVRLIGILSDRSVP